ncbi:uncharacterized protein G2W53_000820 [Senna tora]|uniref:Uncharacterized protein n=1 Tax=Senna tora TaxID=362788 RepID=A0A835CKY2_9FABA|nr:uncharacterized protein G2W53_000820 [Senna tora]
MVRTKNTNYRNLPTSSSSPSSSNPPSSPPPRPKRKRVAPTKPTCSLPRWRTRSMIEHSPIVESSHEPILESVPELVTEPEHETVSEQPRKETRRKQGTCANQSQRANKATQAAIQIAEWEDGTYIFRSLTHGRPSGDAPRPSSSLQTTMEEIRASLARMEAQLAHCTFNN